MFLMVMFLTCLSVLPNGAARIGVVAIEFTFVSVEEGVNVVVVMSTHDTEMSISAVEDVTSSKDSDVAFSVIISCNLSLLVLVITDSLSR